MTLFEKVNLNGKQSSSIFWCFVLILNCGFALTACSSATKYQPLDEHGGYSDGVTKDEIQIARFAGNAYTKSADAADRSLFRAIEQCWSKGYKFPLIYDMIDRSASKTIQRTSSHAYSSPTYLTGKSTSTTNQWSNGAETVSRFNGQVNHGIQSSTSNSWDETYIFPLIDTIYECGNSRYFLGAVVKELSPDEVRRLTRDLMGAVQVIHIEASSPNVNRLLIGDIVLYVSGSRITSKASLAKSINGAEDKSKIRFELIRDGDRKIVYLSATDKTDETYKNVQNIVNNACLESDLSEREICKVR